MSSVGETAGELNPQEEKDNTAVRTCGAANADDWCQGFTSDGCAVCLVQIQGLGTALKILFSEKEIQKLPEHSPSKGFQLTRQEIVALINAFGR